MSLPTEQPFPSGSVGRTGEGGGNCFGGDTLAALDSRVYQDMHWCARCAGKQLFVPVDRFPHGWRGYCLGCEEVVYVLDERTSQEAA